MNQIAEELDRARSTIARRIVATRGLVRPKPKEWTEEEKDLLIRLHCIGKKPREIAKKLGRSENAVEIMFCRHRKTVQSDPRFRRVMQALQFCMNPALILKRAREYGIIHEFDGFSDEEINSVVNFVRKGW